ncbi:monooxygenase [Lactobacillus sp. Sy-1]|uniref:monooxygenase n=1 Tax=Lactobacillus sp. Sy-1 TaxID=2109645 RepID=UPI001C573301|nr:monooxygenase [Lactobacillus sp. Sy-1]MBW1605396.1 monooxygenase [Lactobacillus sp. Sy-1]
MISNIYVTFGSESYLSKIIEKHPERKLYLYNSVTNSDSFEIVDLSDKPTIFESPIGYSVLNHFGTDQWGKSISYITLDLDSNQQKVLDAKINSIISNESLPDGMSSIYSLNIANKLSKRVILTTWNDNVKIADWYRSKSANNLFDLNDQIETNYFETIYKFFK